MLPKVDLSAGGMFEMAQEKQQHEPQLDMSKKDAQRLEIENDQLRAQVKKLQGDKDAIHSALDEIHENLEETTLELQSVRQDLLSKCKALADYEHRLEHGTSELQNAQQELAMKCKELAHQEDQASILPQQSQEATENDLERLQMELRAKDEAIAQQDIKWKERTKRLYVESESKLKIQEEQAQKLSAEQSLQFRKAESEWQDKMKLLKDKFEHDLLQKEEEISRRLQVDFRMQGQKDESGWQNDNPVLRQRSEDKLNPERETTHDLLLEQRSQLEEALGQVQKLQAQLQSAQQDAMAVREDALGHIQKLQIQVQSAQQEAMAVRGRQAQPIMLPSPAPSHPSFAQGTNSEHVTKQLEELKSSHATLLEASHRLTHFFKSNSEQVSREVRELRATVRTLTDSVEAKDKELEDQRSYICAIEAQMEEFDNPPSDAMPGGWTT